MKYLEQEKDQDKVVTMKDKMMEVLSKTQNWKPPSADKFQGYLLKNLTPLYDNLMVHLQNCLDSGVIPE